MIFKNFKYFDFFDAIEMGLYFVIVGYYFLLFAFFLTMRFRTSKKLYWFFFSILFLCLAAGRVFFIAYYFFIPEMSASKAEIAQSLMLFYRIATFFSWLAIACFMGVLGILLFPPEVEPDKKSSKKKNLTSNMKIICRIIFIAIPVFVGILALVLPDSLFMDPDIAKKYNLNVKIITIFGYPVGRFILNIILLPCFVIIIPLLYLYLAFKTYGVLRKSYFLNAVGIFLYYSGRIFQGIFELTKWAHFKAVLPPLVILSALLLILIANNYEQLR